MERNIDAATSQTKIMRQFVESVDDRNVRRELAEDCILDVFGSCAKGDDEVTVYMRARITDHYRHVNFENATLCDTSQEVVLNNRFARSFEVLRRRLKAKRNNVVASTLSLRAESDDENVDDDGKDSRQLTTPLSSYFQVQGSQTMKYIESIGMLEAHNVCEDPFIPFHSEDPFKVKLTLGYRYDYPTTEICLIRYEKEPDSGRVRRALLAPIKSNEASLPDLDSYQKPMLTSNKRQHRKYSNEKCKRFLCF